MKVSTLRTVLFAILFLFFIQMSGTLIESIYILDLLNTTLDAKALGLLFFFAPVLLLPFRKKMPAWVLTLLLVLLAASCGLTPYLNTVGRLTSSGIATAASVLLIGLLFAVVPQKNSFRHSLQVSASLALATALSVLLRTVNYSIDTSLTADGGWVGWALAMGLCACWFLVQKGSSDDADDVRRGFGAGLGLMLVLTLLLFAFSAPAVLARWTAGNYAVIVIAVSLMSLGYAAMTIYKPEWVHKMIAHKALLWSGNFLFGLALVGTVLAHRVSFPLTPEALPVVITSPVWFKQIPLALTLFLFPIVFMDGALLMDNPIKPKSNSSFVSGLLVGIFALVVLTFMQIFTNVWGYVEPISPLFRNKFWLPFALMVGLLVLLVILRGKVNSLPDKAKQKLKLGWAACFGLILLVTAGFALWSVRTPEEADVKTSLQVMTYNIQQGNDSNAEKSYLRQLAKIREINPDILALQESDSPRVSLNNNDYVRYFASVLGYYSYYGPATVTGTYGTAILSRYPLENVRSVFSYSDMDEVGTAEAEIVVGDRRFTIYNVHPDGSDTAMLSFADTLLNRSLGKENVIALGDFNLRSDKEAYQRIAEVYANVPNSDGHIDHIFLSSDLVMRNPVYVPAPESATDHPFLYAEIIWTE